MFTEISRFGSSDFTQHDTMAGLHTTLGIRKLQEKVTADEKFNALKAAYEDPFVEIFNLIKLEEDEEKQKNTYVAPQINEHHGREQDSAEQSTTTTTTDQQKEMLKDKINQLELTRIEEEAH